MSRRPHVLVPSLCLSVLVLGLPVAAQASAPPATGSAAHHATKKKPTTAKHRVDKTVPHATRFSDVRVAANGKITRTIYQQPVNYRTAEGQWRAIDSSLVETHVAGYAAQSAANTFQVLVPQNVDRSPLKIEGPSSWVAFAPRDASGEPDIDGSSASFASSEPGTRFDYQVLSTGLKEDIVLDSAPATAPTYTFDLSMSPGLRPRLDNAGNIAISKASGRHLYTIPAPVMSDATTIRGVESPATSTDVTTRLARTSSGWSLTVAPDLGWLSDPARAYPVQIDPTVTVTTDGDDFAGSRDCWIGNADDTASHCTAADGATTLWAGTDANVANPTVRRSLLRFDLSSVPAGVDITRAQLQLYLDSTKTRGTTANPVDYVVRRLTMGWSNNATWKKNSAGSQPTDFWTAPGAGADTDATLGTLGLHGGSGEDGWQTWELSLGTVRGWYAGTMDNDGVLLKQTGSETANNELGFRSGDAPGNHPRLVITYNNPPTTPSALAISPCLGTCSPASTPTLTPTLSATSTDSDGGTLTYTFNVTTSAGTAVTSGTASATAGNPATWHVPSGKLVDDSAYKFTVSVSDGTDGAGPSSAYSFTTDTDKPPAVPTAINESPCKPNKCTSDVPAGTAATVISLTPTLTGTLSDPDTPRSGLNADFEVRAVGSGTNIDTGTATPNPSTGVATYTVKPGKLSDDSHYEFRVGNRDATSTTWSAWTPFDTDTDKAPAVPSAVSATPCAPGHCVADVPAGTAATIISLTPTFSATLSDPDTGLADLHADFEVREVGSSTTLATSTSQPNTTTGVATYTIAGGKLNDDSHYEFRVGNRDATSTTWSAWTPVDTDTDTKPDAPTGLEENPCKPGHCAADVPAGTATVVTSVTPSLSGTLHDPDTALADLNADFEVRKVGTSTTVATGTVQPDATTGVATFAVASGKLDDDSHYEFRMSDRDATSTTWSAWTPFDTDTDKAPAVPTDFTETPCKPDLCADKVPDGTPPAVMSVSPTLSATLADPDTGLADLFGDFQVREVGTTTAIAVGAEQPNATTGVVSFTVPGGILNDDGHYEFRVGDRDATSTTWSDWTAFDVKLDKIATIPSVTMTPCISGCSSWVTDTTSPTFTAVSDDADDSEITYHFEIQNPDGSAVTTGKVADVEPGKAVAWKASVGSLTQGSYVIRVGAADATQEGDSAISWGDFQPFAVQFPAHSPTQVNSCPAITSHVTWDVDHSPYVLHCTEVVKSGGVLEIEPGTVVKLANGSIDVQDGQLNAHGSQDYPIYFTSYADDSQLGDTNGDGSSSSPAPGNWDTAITIGHTTADLAASLPVSTIKNVAFMYGGDQHVNVCRYSAAAVEVTSLGRALITHDDFAQLGCNAISVGNNGSNGIGQATVTHSYFEPTIYGMSLAQTTGGDFSQNIFASPTFDETWVVDPDPSMHQEIHDNYISGTYWWANTNGAGPDAMGFHDNALATEWGGPNEPYNSSGWDLTSNWWGVVPSEPTLVGLGGVSGTRPYGCINPSTFFFAYNGFGFNHCAVGGVPGVVDFLDVNQGFANKILPALTSKPPLPVAGLEAHPATPPTIDLEQLFGNSNEYANRGSGDQDDPVNSENGSYTESDTDASVANVGYPVSVQRTYNSLDSKSGPLGQGWSWNYEAGLNLVDDTHVTFLAGDGQRVKYTKKNGAWVGSSGVTADLTASGGGYDLTTRAGVIYSFNANGVLQSILDRNGQGVSLTHENGQVTQASGSGRSIAFDYTANGLLHRATLEDSRTVVYDYTDGRLTSVKDLGGSTTMYAYDDQGRLTTETNDANVDTLQLAYDVTTGRVSDEWDALDHHTTFAWDPVEQVSTVTDPAGGRWIDDYDDGTLFARVDPKGRCTFYEFSKDVQLTSMVTPRGDESTYKYDDNGDLKATRNQTGLVTTDYNSHHQPLTATDGKGVVTDYDYDNDGNLSEVTTTSYKKGPYGDPVPDEVRHNWFTYFPDGEVETAKDARGKVTTYGYNSHGDLTDVTTAEGRHTSYGYDTVGRRTSVVDPRGYDTGNSPADYTTTTEYNDRNQVTKVLDPLSVGDPTGHHFTSSTYDPQLGRLMSVTDADQHTTSYTYFDDGRVHTVTEPGSPAAVTTYTYDVDGNVHTVTDADNREVTYHYDAANEVTAKDTPLGTYTYGYDNDGRVTSYKEPGDAAATTFRLNARGNVLSTSFPVGSAHVSYAYDVHGNRTSMANYGSSGSLVSSSTYTYDGYDQVTSVATSTGAAHDNYAYSYDANGVLHTSTGPEGARTYDYDDDGLLTSVHKATDDLAEYTYTSAGQPKTVTYADGSHQTLGYDKAGRLTSHSDLTADGQTITDDSYGLDNVGNPTSIVHHATSGDRTDTYQYDERNRLTDVCWDTAACSGATDYVSWQYDAVGNRTQEKRPSGTTTYDYDATTGQLTGTTGPGGTTTYDYNTGGQLTDDGTTTYTYNPDATVATQTTSSVTTTYAYDGDGRRLSATVGTSGTPDSVTRFAWDPQTYLLSAEFDGSGALLRDYSYGLGPIGFSTATGAGSNYSFHTDFQGSVTAVTGPDGDLDSTTSYEPYGVVRDSQVLDATAPTSPIAWAGQYTDPDGQSNLRARRYDPTIGAFAVPDPAASTAASATYTYANSNPMVYSDPTGLSASGLLHFLSDNFDPIKNATNAIQAAGAAWQVCHGGKGSCGLAIANAAFQTLAFFDPVLNVLADVAKAGAKEAVRLVVPVIASATVTLIRIGAIPVPDPEWNREGSKGDHWLNLLEVGEGSLSGGAVGGYAGDMAIQIVMRMGWFGIFAPEADVAIFGFMLAGGIAGALLAYYGRDEIMETIHEQLPEGYDFPEVPRR